MLLHRNTSIFLVKKFPIVFKIHLKFSLHYVINFCDLGIKLSLLLRLGLLNPVGFISFAKSPKLAHCKTFCYIVGMKKVLKFLLLFFVFLGVFATGILPVFCSELWSELTQKERQEYVDNCLKNIGSIQVPEISEKILEDEFGLSTNRDPNFKLHSQGITHINGANSTRTFTRYQPQGLYLMGTKSPVADVQVGYVINKDNYMLEFNKNGSFKFVTVRSDKTSEGIYFEKIYSKNLNLKSTIYYDYPYRVIFDSNNEVEKIFDYGQAYNIRGKKIKLKG